MLLAFLVPSAIGRVPLLVALSLGGVAVGRVIPMMLCYFLYGLLVTLPLHYVWGAVFATKRDQAHSQGPAKSPYLNKFETVFLIRQA